MKAVFTPQRTQEGWGLNRLAYRTLKDRDVKCTDPTINLADYRITGYVCGTMVRKTSEMTWNHFDWASLIEESTNPINGKQATLFIGSRDRINTVLITEKVTIKTKIKCQKKK